MVFFSLETYTFLEEDRRDVCSISQILALGLPSWGVIIHMEFDCIALASDLLCLGFSLALGTVV